MPQTCILCQKDFQKGIQHAKQCPNIFYKQQEVRMTKSSIILNQKITICSRCQIICPNKQQFVKHNRSCKKKLSKQSKSVQSSVFQEVKQLKKGQIQKHQFSDQQFVQNKFPTLMLDYYRASMFTVFVNWKQSNKGVRNDVLFQIFKKYTQNQVKLFNSQMPQLSLANLCQKYPKIKWSLYFTNTNQLFDKKYIESKIEKLSIYKKNKIKRFLNDYFKDFQSVFQQLQYQKNPPNLQQQKIVLVQQLLMIYQKLISTNKKNYVHLAVDLMIMYQCGQRFPSTCKNIDFIQRMNLQLNKKQQSIKFQMKSSKTNKIMQIILDQQLVFIMRKINWTNFLSNKYYKNLYKNLSTFLPFSCYCLRRGYITYLYVRNIGQNGLKHLSQHKYNRNLQYYTKKIVSKTLQIYKTYLRINDIQGFQKPILKCESIDISSGIIFEQNWFQKLIENLENKKISCGQDIYIYKGKNQHLNFNKNIELRQKQLSSMSVQSDPQSQSSLEPIIIEKKKTININGLQYSYLNGRVSSDDLYIQQFHKSCCLCQGNAVVACTFCTNPYCEHCKYKFCPCMKIHRQKEQDYIKLTKNYDIVDCQIQLPERYMQNALQNQDFNELRTIIYARSLLFSNVATGKLDQQDLPQNITRIKIDDFYKYIKYQYFPPIKAKVWGQSNNNGVGFGIFATQNINTHVLIGQYAGNIISRETQRFSQRTDMIFRLNINKIPGKSKVIAPLTHAGYISLINQSQRPNCETVLVIIQNKLRILVYTCAKIKKNEQLFINYFWQTDQMDDEIQNSNNLHFYIKVQNNNCYFVAIIKALHLLKEYFKTNRTQNFVLRQLNRIFKYQKQVDGKKLLTYICNNTSLRLGMQQDAHQLLTFILDIYLQNNLLEKIKILVYNQIKCHQCSTITTSQNCMSTISLQMSFDFKDIFNIQFDELTDVQCQTCQKKTKKNNHIMHLFSQLIVIQLKRFIIVNPMQPYLRIQKNTSNKHMPKIMEINQNQYQLIIIILHSGSYQHGHYTVVDLVTQKCYNGAQIQRINNEIIESEGYLYIYKKKLIDKAQTDLKQIIK